MVSSTNKNRGYRPIYENKETLQMEERFKSEFENSFNQLELRKLPRSYNLDFAVWEKNPERILALIEYKQRRYSSDQMNRMGGVKISLNKIKHSLEYSDLFGVPCRLIYKLSDNKDLEYYRFDVTKENVRQCKIGFIDLVSRGDAEDVEPSLVIPMSLFHKKMLG
jgi:hypothetical protein